MRIVLFLILMLGGEGCWAGTAPGTVITITAEVIVDGRSAGTASASMVVIKTVFEGQTFYSARFDRKLNGCRVRRILGALGPGNIQDGIQTIDGSLF